MYLSVDPARIRLHNDDPVRQVDRLVHIMRYKDDRFLLALLTAPQREQELLQGDSGARIKCAERFVHQQDLRIHRKRSCNGNALLLSAGELEREFVLIVRQLHLLQKFLRTRLPFLTGQRAGGLLDAVDHIFFAVIHGNKE